MVINGIPHGPQRGTTACQLHMRVFKDGDTITIEPFRAKAFPSSKTWWWIARRLIGFSRPAVMCRSIRARHPTAMRFRFPNRKPMLRSMRRLALAAARVLRL